MDHPPEQPPGSASEVPSTGIDAAAKSRARALRLGLAALVFAIPLTLYLRTLSPTIYPGDGAELTAAAWCLGVPHPTGYPLFTVLGHGFQRLGLGSPAFSMNLMCALFGALACLGAYCLQREIWRSLVGRRVARRPVYRCAAAAGALALAASSAWWSHSTTTEVYSLLLVFITWIWAVGLRLIRRPTARGLASLALLTGLGFLHHQLLLITLPLSAAGVAAFWRNARQHQAEANTPRFTDSSAPETRAKALATAALLLALPLLGYAYLPWRAAAAPPLNYGDPRGLTGLAAHLTGKQFRGTRILAHPSGQPLAPDEILPHVKLRFGEILTWMGRQHIAPILRKPTDPPGRHTYAAAARAPLLGLICIVLAAMGLVALRDRSPLAALGLGLGGAINLVIVMIYTIPDIDAYQIPLWLLVVSLAIPGPMGLAQLLAREAAPDARSSLRRTRRVAGAGCAALALAVFSVWNWYPPEQLVNKADHRAAHEYARSLLEILPPDAVVFTTGDFDIFPLWYAQICENRRPDVAVVGSNFVFSRWYAAMLAANLPEGVEVFVADEPPSKTSARWLVAFLGGMVAPQLQAKRPAYITIFRGDEKRAMIASHYDLKLTARFASLTPWPGSPPLELFEIQDPNDFSKNAMETLARPEYFPLYRFKMARRHATPADSPAPNPPEG